MGTNRTFLISTAIGLVAFPHVGAAQNAVFKAPTALPQQFSWAGLYLGANVGEGWSHSGLGCTFVGGSPCSNGYPNHFDPKGALGGVQAGYNWQTANLVFGFEADFDWMGIRDVAHFPLADPNYANAQVASRYDWLGTVRGRAGFTVDKALFYATGGYAYAHLSQHYFDDNSGTFPWKGTRNGWVAGGGVEYALSRNWSVKAEYLHVNLQSSSITASFATNAVTTFQLKNDLNIVRGGLNYRF
jgi:outer membrane immunogenic protein